MTETARCEPTAHRFAKFDDATVFCQRCGEQRVMDVQKLIAMMPTPIYLPCPGQHWPPAPLYPGYPWQPWWGGTTIAQDTSSLDSTTTPLVLT